LDVYRWGGDDGLVESARAEQKEGLKNFSKLSERNF